MTGRVSRRRVLRGLAASGALARSPVLARTGWTIRGAERGALRLVFHTDIHANTDWRTPEALDRAAEAINAEVPDLVLCGGDLISGGFRATREAVRPRWDAYMQMARAIHGEQHAVIGNHDLVAARPADGSPPAADPRLEFRRRLGLGETHGAFSALGYRFMLLDAIQLSDGDPGYRGWIASAQMDWLRGEVSRLARDTPIVLVLHVPLLTTFFSATKGARARPDAHLVVANNREVLALFAEYNLVLVLQGHLHVTEFLQWCGTTFLTGGAISGGWWRGSYHGTEEGFCVLTLRSDRIEWEYVGYGWDARRP